MCVCVCVRVCAWLARWRTIDQMGWVAPEPFKALAADGHTELYALLWRPPGLVLAPPRIIAKEATAALPTTTTTASSSASSCCVSSSFRCSGSSGSSGSGTRSSGLPLPVLENIYTGPHSAHVPKRFSSTACSQAMAAAALGFAVVFIDGRGYAYTSVYVRMYVC